MICKAGTRRCFKLGSINIAFGPKTISPTELRIKHALMYALGSGAYLSHGFDASVIAGETDTSREEVNRFVRNYTGQRFSTICKIMRLERAKELMLESPGLSAMAIGRMVGIKDKTDFRKQFEDYEGCSPAVWRTRQCP